MGEAHTLIDSLSYFTCMAHIFVKVYEVLNSSLEVTHNQMVYSVATGVDWCHRLRLLSNCALSPFKTEHSFAHFLAQDPRPTKASGAKISSVSGFSFLSASAQFFGLNLTLLIP
jgi:hypothetical protein